jgi:hypothetical protein
VQAEFLRLRESAIWEAERIRAESALSGQYPGKLSLADLTVASEQSGAVFGAMYSTQGVSQAATTCVSAPVVELDGGKVRLEDAELPKTKMPDIPKPPAGVLAPTFHTPFS